MMYWALARIKILRVVLELTDAILQHVLRKHHILLGRTGGDLS